MVADESTTSNGVLDRFWACVQPTARVDSSLILAPDRLKAELRTASDPAWAVWSSGFSRPLRRSYATMRIADQLTVDNFAILAAETARREANCQNGSPTTLIGPPTTGARLFGEFWRDALGDDFVCTAAGTSGTCDGNGVKH